MVLIWTEVWALDLPATYLKVVGQNTAPANDSDIVKGYILGKATKSCNGLNSKMEK